jgi:hypothetical protein
VNLSVFCFECIGHLLQLVDLAVMVSLSMQFFWTAIGLQELRRDLDCQLELLFASQVELQQQPQRQQQQRVRHVESAIEEPHTRLELSSSCCPWKVSGVNLLHPGPGFHAFSRVRQQKQELALVSWFLLLKHFSRLEGHLAHLQSQPPHS